MKTHALTNILFLSTVITWQYLWGSLTKNLRKTKEARYHSKIRFATVKAPMKASPPIRLQHMYGRCILLLCFAICVSPPVSLSATSGLCPTTITAGEQRPISETLVKTFTEISNTHQPSAQSAQPQRFSRPKGKSLRIPFRYINGFILIDVLINDRLPLCFIFDTGSKHTILTDNFYIPLLGQVPEEKILLVGSDLSQPITGRIMRSTLLRVGEIDLQNQSIILIEEKVIDLDALIGEPVQGILGIGSFGAYALKIDYEAGLIDLLDPKRIRTNEKDISVPIRVEEAKAFINVEAKIHEGKTQTLSLLLDTGASLSLLIQTDTADTTLLPPKTVTGVFGYGLGGYLNGYVGRSDVVTIGAFELPDIITHFQIFPTNEVFLNLPYREGIIGNGILDRFIVTIDFSNKILRLHPTKKSKRKAKYDRSGIRLVRDGTQLNKFRVQHVVANSPADRAGINVGDELLKVNRIPIAFRTLPGIENILRRKIGRKIRLTLLTDEGEVKKVIQLEELI